VNNIPPFPPAERFGTALLALIHAIAARYGWLMPKWLIKRMEDEVRGLVEAFSLVAAQGARLLAEAAEAAEAAKAAEAAEPAPQPVQVDEAEPARVRGPARSVGRTRIARSAAQQPDAGRQEATPLRTGGPRRRRPGHRNCRRAGRRATVLRPHSLHPPPSQKTARAKPAPWHAHFVTI
jgi:hypothetical protein